MVKKTQEESEQPVKGYQLDAVAAQVKDLSDNMKAGFVRVDKSLETLLQSTASQVTPQQFAENMTALRMTLEGKLDEEIKKVHLEYRPLKKTINWLLVTVVTLLLTIFGQVVFILNLTKGG